MDDWENVFQSRRESVIDDKVEALLKEAEATERARLVRPVVTEFFRKLAAPSAMQYAKENPER